MSTSMRPVFESVVAVVVAVVVAAVSDIGSSNSNSNWDKRRQIVRGANTCDGEDILCGDTL